MSQPRVFLIDSSIYIFRAWHVYHGSINSRAGEPANAVFGFADFLFQLLQQKRPTHIACAFDAAQTDSYRKGLYPAYKANREPAPEELKRQFGWCRSLCAALGVPAFDSTRFEADDIIGTLAADYRTRGFAVTVISADKDLTQLVLGEQDQWWDYARSTVLDAQGIRRQFGVLPGQIADMLALSGDKVDNIPGIPGVGYTTAARILQRYANIESILSDPDGIATMKFRGAARVAALVASHRAILPLNKQLTSVVCDIPLDQLTAVSLTGTATFPMGATTLRWRGVDESALALFGEELAFSTAWRQRWLRLHRSSYET